MATIRDIAQLSGFSITTVSRVLNHDETLSVTENTRKKIMDVAEELNYKTLKQRSTKQQSSQLTIGLIMFKSEEEEINDPYFLSIRLGIEKMCSKKGIRLIKIYRQNYGLELSNNPKINGAIVVGKITEEEVQEIMQVTEYITFVDYSPMENQFDSVTIDFRQAMIKVLDYLLASNHKKIGFIGGKEIISPDNIHTDLRERAFREYLTLKGMLNESYIHVGYFNTEDGYQLMMNVLDQNEYPSAFFIASDSMAIGAMRALHERRISIPEDISIIGFNDIPSSKYLQPSLSSVKVYTEFMGESAVDIMIERLETKRPIPRKIVIPTELVIRESSTAKIQ